jgi:hypothetical protein
MKKAKTMDAIEFYHTDECSTDVYEAMEQYAQRRVNEKLKEALKLVKDSEHIDEAIHYVNELINPLKALKR